MTDSSWVTPDGGLWGGRLLVFDSLPSTNLWALEHAATCQQGDVIRALEQTAGRGRFERRWLSPGRQELTFSIGLRANTIPAEMATMLGPATALAVRDTVQAQGIATSVKWPNDVLVGNRKIAGILIEGDPQGACLVIGIGLNVNLQEEVATGPDMRLPATSIGREKGRLIDPEPIFLQVLASLATWLGHVLAGQRQTILNAWAEHDALRGRRVRVAMQDGERQGWYAGITAIGAMRLRDDTGTEHIMLAGDVSVVASEPT